MRQKEPEDQNLKEYSLDTMDIDTGRVGAFHISICILVEFHCPIISKRVRAEIDRAGEGGGAWEEKGNETYVRWGGGGGQYR